MKRGFKSLILIMVGVFMFGLVGCGSTSTSSNSNKNDKETVTTSTTQKTEEKTKEETKDKDVLKDAVIEGKLTDEEKSKIVELTEKSARATIDTDYTKDTLDTMKQFFNYTTEDITKDFTDDKLQKILDGQKMTKEISKVENITYKKITSNSQCVIVDFTAKVICKSHTNPNKNGKQFDMDCHFIYNKDFKIVGYDISGI